MTRKAALLHFVKKINNLWLINNILLCSQYTYQLYSYLNSHDDSVNRHSDILWNKLESILCSVWQEHPEDGDDIVRWLTRWPPTSESPWWRASACWWWSPQSWPGCWWLLCSAEFGQCTRNLNGNNLKITCVIALLHSLPISKNGSCKNSGPKKTSSSILEKVSNIAPLSNWSSSLRVVFSTTRGEKLAVLVSTSVTGTRFVCRGKVARSWYHW